MKLAHPYPRGVVEPHDYQDAHEISGMMEATIELLSSPSLSVSLSHTLSLSLREV